MPASLPPKISACEYIDSIHSLDQLPGDTKPQVALAGRSNVGKSSLLNRIVGRKNMARVSGTPGKTRALNFFLVNGQYYLVDLPGYGYARASKQMRRAWSSLIEAYLQRAPQLIGLVLLLDGRRELTPEDHQLLAWLAQRELPVLVAVTKADKLSRSKVSRKVSEVERETGAGALAVSSVTGLGKNELVASLHALVNEYFSQTKA